MSRIFCIFVSVNQQVEIEKYLEEFRAEVGRLNKTVNELTVENARLNRRIESDAVAMPPVDISGYRTLRSSDAHYLENILEPTFTLEVEDKSAQSLFNAIAGC